MSLNSEATTVAQNLGRNIRVARQRGRWTTHELADKLGVSERTVRNVEHGRTSVSLDTYLRACILLDVDLLETTHEHIMQKRVRHPMRAVISPEEVDF